MLIRFSKYTFSSLSYLLYFICSNTESHGTHTHTKSTELTELRNIGALSCYCIFYEVIHLLCFCWCYLPTEKPSFLQWNLLISEHVNKNGSCFRDRLALAF